MTKRVSTLVACFLICGVALAWSQEVPSTISNSAEENSHSIQKKLPEVEFAASPSFRTASLIENIRGDLNFEGHYFGGNENNTGYTAASWSFGREHWKLVPSFGVNFGDNGYRTMPAVGLRWEYEHEWFVSEGLLVQGLLPTSFNLEESEESMRVAPFIADGNHVSAQWRRLMAGGTWEHIHFREGQEWKAGLRVAYRIFPSTSLTMFVMGPGKEVRGGILFRPETSK